MNEILKSLSQAGSEVTEKISTQLAISQESGASYNSELHTFMQNTLGMPECIVTKELNSQKKAIEATSVKLSVQKEFNKFLELVGDKIILDYKGLVELCKKHDLFYAHTYLFSGNMTPEAIAEAKAFSFDKARTCVRVGDKILGNSVVEWNYNASFPSLIIAAPITMFKLTGPTRLIISNREIIECDCGSTYVNKKSCSTQDPILLMPFKASDDQIYFCVITNW